MAGRGRAAKRSDQRARRNPKPGTVTLPAAGRKGRAPAWPMGDDAALRKQLKIAREQLSEAQEDLAGAGTATERSRIHGRVDKARARVNRLSFDLDVIRPKERALWSAIWKTPQATQWEPGGWFQDVAQYVHHKARAEFGDLENSKEARQWSDRLGLSPKGMQDRGWEFAPSGDDDRSAPRRHSTLDARYGDLRVVQ